MKTMQKGFTLVEIAIVLVIIGLLLGGILKGQEMITQAKIKNAIADFSGISAAYHGYQDRYRAIPGDDNGAAARWNVTGIDGDRDGIVENTYNATTANVESRLWWDHLRRAGFVAGTGQEQPFNAVVGKLGVQTGSGSADAQSTAITPVLGTDGSGTNGISGLMVCSANLPDKIAVAIDTQMDDGIPVSGSVRGSLQTQPNPNVPAQAATTYVENGTNVYVVCRTF